MGDVAVNAGVAVNAVVRLAAEVTVATRVRCSVGDSVITGVGVGNVCFVGLDVRDGGSVISVNIKASTVIAIGDVSMKVSTVTTGVWGSVPRGVGVGRCASGL